LTSEGVDHTSSALLHYKDSIAVITQSIGAAGGANATLHGTKGAVEVPMFLSPAGFTVIDANGFKPYYRYEKEKNARPIGYAYEILHFADCIDKGLRDSEWIPRSETIAVAEQMEQIRRENEIILGSERNGR
jgi:predicted dehydrogenase